MRTSTAPPGISTRLTSVNRGVQEPFGRDSVRKPSRTWSKESAANCLSSCRKSPKTNRTVRPSVSLRSRRRSVPDHWLTQSIPTNSVACADGERGLIRRRALGLPVSRALRRRAAGGLGGGVSYYSPASAWQRARSSVHRRSRGRERGGVAGSLLMNRTMAGQC